MRKVAAWFKSELAGWGRAIRANPGALWLRVGLIGLAVFDLRCLPRIVDSPLFGVGGMVHRCIAGFVIVGVFMPFAPPMKIQLLRIVALLVGFPATWAMAYGTSLSLGGSYAECIEAARVTTFLFSYASFFASHKWGFERKEPVKPE